MNKSKHSRRAFALLLACAPLAALAKDHGNGHGHGKGHDRDDDDHGHGHDDHGPRYEVRQGAYFEPRYREAARTAWVEHGHGHCPPGLAKKHNGCMPPGQARWAVGAPVPPGVVVAVVPQPVLVTMPPAPVGYRYVRLGADMALLRVQGSVVIDLVPGVFY